MGFREKLDGMIRKNDSLLCIGLDVDRERVPSEIKHDRRWMERFNESIISSTADLVCCYKINLAFYEAYGTDGFEAIIRTIDMIPDDIPVIIDGKRNDIGNSARMYARCAFEVLKGDAVTVNPYLGFDSVKPFLEYKDKYVFVLCRTSNPSAREFQDLDVGGKKLYQVVAERIREWGENCGAVVGATYPEEIGEVRRIVGNDRILLIPGVGAQGGDLKRALASGWADGGNVIINVSRGIIYSENARKSAEMYREEINRLREEIV